MLPIIYLEVKTQKFNLLYEASEIISQPDILGQKKSLSILKLLRPPNRLHNIKPRFLLPFRNIFKFGIYKITKTNYGAASKANNSQFIATIRLTSNLFIKQSRGFYTKSTDGAKKSFCINLCNEQKKRQSG